MSNHDSIFKATFEQLDLARGELELVLPAAVLEQLDLATLELRPGGYLDEALQATQSDLLYAVRTRDGREALVIVLWEHQSRFDAKMPLRLLRYIVSVWETWLRDHPTATTVPIVIPVVLHHGETGWRAAPELASMLDASPELLEATRAFVPHFGFVLDDLSGSSAEELAARALHALARLVQLALWSSRSMSRLQSAAPIMGAVAATLTRDARAQRLLLQLYAYLWRTAPADIAADEVRSILLQIAGPEGAEDVMNAAEELMERGRAEGLQRGHAEGLQRGRAEGLQRGRAEGLQRGRAEGLRTAIEHLLAVRKLNLSELGAARLAACTDVAVLTAWLEQAATAASEAEIFAGAEGA